MIKSFLTLILINWITLTAWGKSVTPPLLPIQHWQLANKVQVYFLPTTTLPILDIAVMVDAGSNRDNLQPGLANMMIQTLGEGTSTMDADTIAENFDKVGALFTAASYRDHSIFTLRSLSEPQYLNPALHIFSALLLDPQLPVKSFQRVKNNVLQQLYHQQQSPTTLADDLFYQQLYQGTAYGHNPWGTVKSVKKIAAKDLVNFYHQFYVGKNTTLTMVGNLTSEQAHTIANNLLANLPQGNQASSMLPLPLAHQSKPIHRSFPSTQTIVRIGQLGITPQAKDYYALQVGNYILGGGALVSRLFNEVREQRGLSYNISSQFKILRDKGPFVIDFQTRNDQAQRTIQVVKDTLQRFLTEGPTEAEVTAAKQHLINSFPLNLNSNAAILNKIAYLAFYGYPLDFFDHYRAEIQGVTKSDIQQAFQHHLQSSQLITVTVGPTPQRHG